MPHMEKEGGELSSSRMEVNQYIDAALDHVNNRLYF